MIEPIAFTAEMLAVLLVLGLAVYLFVTEVVRVDVAAIVVLLVLGISGIVPADRLFRGFASDAVISIIAVMIMGAGLDRTGVMGVLAAHILRVGGSTERRIVPIVCTIAAGLSSFMQNIGAAALFLPVVSRISARSGIALSRLLMPMGFCAILGGTLTMVGSSPLILLNDLLDQANAALPPGVEPMRPFHLFAVTPVGLALVVAGVVYFRVGAFHLLPTNRSTSAGPAATTAYFEAVYGIQGDIYEVRVPVDSPLAGMKVADAEAVPSAPFILGMKTFEEIRLEPPIDEVVGAGAVLALMGSDRQVREFRRAHKLEMQREMQTFVEVLNPMHAGVSELVVPPGSALIGKTVREIKMRRNHGIQVLAVYRGEEVLRRDRVASLPIRAGDTLIAHSAWNALGQIGADRNAVVVTDYPRETTRPHKLAHAVGFFALAIALVLFSDLRLSVALLVGATGMVASGVLSMDEAYRAVGWQTVFLLACLLPLGLAMESTGTAAWIAQEVLRLLGAVPLWVVQAALALLATGFTLVMSNVGATVLLVPIAVKLAVGAGGDPAVFALTVALATSNSFFIPTHQVNALIMGPAGYRVADFMRAGGMMTLIFVVVLLVALNLFY